MLPPPGDLGRLSMPPSLNTTWFFSTEWFLERTDLLFHPPRNLSPFGESMTYLPVSRYWSLNIIFLGPQCTLSVVHSTCLIFLESLLKLSQSFASFLFLRLSFLLWEVIFCARWGWVLTDPVKGLFLRWSCFPTLCFSFVLLLLCCVLSGTVSLKCNYAVKFLKVRAMCLVVFICSMGASVLGNTLLTGSPAHPLPFKDEI